MQFMNLTNQTKIRVTYQDRGHSMVIYEVIFNGYEIEVLDLTSTKRSENPAAGHDEGNEHLSE